MDNELDRQRKSAPPAQSTAEPLPILRDEAAAEIAPAEQEEKAFSEEFDRIRNELLYLKADFENYKMRLLREQKEAIHLANESMVRDLVPVADHLHYAVEHMREEARSGTDEKATKFLEGISMIENELSGFFQRWDVKFFGSPGEAFNPEIHEAISEERVDAERAGKIVGVVGKGCLFKGRLLYPARVIVGSKEKAVA